MASVIPSLGFAHAELSTSKSAPYVGFVGSTQRQPTDPIFLTQLRIRGLVIGSNYAVYDNTSTLITSGEFLTDPTNYNDQPAYTESDTVSAYGMYYAYKYKNVTFLLTRVSSLIYLGLDANTNTTLSRTAAAALTGISLDAGTKKITVTSTHSWSDVYDYAQYWQSLPANVATLKDGEILSTVLGTQYTLLSTWQLVLEAEVTGGVDFVGDVVINAVFNLTGFNVTGTVFFDFPGTYSWTNMLVDEVDTIAGETVTINPTNTTITLNSDPANITINAPPTTFTLTSSETGTLLQIFDTATQTVIDSTTGTSLVYNYTGTPTYDAVAQKAGFLPQRVTGQLMDGTNKSVTFTMVEDFIYDNTHTLLYTTDLSYNRTTKKLTLSTRQLGRDIYSALIDAFIAQTTLRNTPFPIITNGPTSYFFIDDAQIIDASSLDNWFGAGIRYYNSSDVITDEWVSLASVGDNTAGETAEFQQVAGSSTTDARATGNIDQIIKVYENGVYDYRGHLVAKYQVNGYREVRADVPSIYSVSTLEPIEYIVAMSPIAIGAATGDPALTGYTITDHGATPVSWNGKDFSITIEDTAGTNSGEDLLRELNYNLSLDATFSSKDPFNWPEMILEAGDRYETARGYTEDDLGNGLKGVRVIRSGGTAHPDFLRFQADDGTYYTPVVLAQASLPNLTGAGRIQVYNSTAAAVGVWQANTAYVLGDRVLKTTGLDTDLGAGVFFVCTTAGTSGGTEPTWVTAAVENTTNDNTVVWTVYPVEAVNTTTSGAYSASWVDGTYFTAGDTIRIRWTALDKLPISTSGIATADSTTTFLDTPVSDSVYTSYGIDGSTVTEYTADLNNIQVDVNDPDNVFYIDRFYAWWKYNSTQSGGIRNFFGGVTAQDTSNIFIENTVVDLYFDNVKNASARQGDNIVISRRDGAYPQAETTSGGGGLGFYYTGIGYSTSSGSGLDTTERNKLLGLRDYNPESDAMEGSLTYQQAQRIMLAESAGKVSVSGTTVTFRDQADTKNRITATVDSNGQRTSVTTDGS